jgi:hypothetical protein
MNLIWLSVVLGIVSTVLDLYISYYHVSQKLREYRETVNQMEADQASEEEILEFMDRDIDVDESKFVDQPAWMAIIGIFAIVSSFVLLVMGIIRKY